MNLGDLRGIGHEARHVRNEALGERRPLRHLAAVDEDGARAVEKKDILPVVLGAGRVDIEALAAAGPGGEDAVALRLLADPERRGGEVDDHVGPLRLEHVDRLEGVVVVPQVFTEKHPHLPPRSANRQLERRDEIGRRHAELFGELRERIKMPGVVKLAVFGEERFRREPSKHAVAHERPIGGHKRGVVFPRPPILTAKAERRHAAEDRLMPAEHGPHVPPDRRTAPAGVGDDLVIHAPEVAKKGVVLPFIAEEVAGQGHLGKEHKRRPGCACLIDAPEDPGEVHLGVPRDHLHLANDDRAIGGGGERGSRGDGHRDRRHVWTSCQCGTEHRGKTVEAAGRRALMVPDGPTPSRHHRRKETARAMETTDHVRYHQRS